MTVATRALFTGTTPAPTPGAWTPDGSPATIDAGAGYKAFPGVARLDAGRLLLVYYSGADHVDVASVCKGRIGTLTGTSVSWGSAFTIYDPATYGFRCSDGLSVIDGTVIVAGCLYDGSVNGFPRVLVANDSAADLTSATTWGVYAITFAEGDDENLPTGRVIKVGASYVLGATAWSSGISTAGVLINDDPIDWSTPTWVPIGSSGSLSEICIDKLPGQWIRALMRRETGTSTYKALSTDGGATWDTPSSAHAGHGFPAFRSLTDSTLLTLCRDSQFGDMAWLTSDDAGVTWGTKTVLDTTGTIGEYGTMVQLDSDHVLAVYSVEMSSTDADLYSQVFTRS